MLGCRTYYTLVRNCYEFFSALLTIFLFNICEGTMSRCIKIALLWRMIIWVF